MKHSLILRGILSLAALGAAFAAQAFSVSLVSAGTYSLSPTDPNVFTQDESVLVSHIAPLPALATLHVDGTYSPFSTIATYTSGSGTLKLELDYAHTEVGGFGISTDSGTWVYLGGTGSYASLSGNGSYSINYNADDDQFASTTVVGSLEAVPEPASMAALGVGVAALMRRRKKA